MKLIKKFLLFGLALAVTSILAVYLFPNQIFSLTQNIGKKIGGLHDRSALIDHQTIAYLDNDNMDKPTVVLVHGITGDKQNWLMIAPKLTQNYRLIAVDLLGHGDSSKPLDGDYLVSSQAKRIYQLLLQLNIKSPVHIVGNSMGGHIAGYFAANYPKATKTLTLMNNAGINNDTPSMRRLLKGLAEKKFPLFAEKPEDIENIQKLVFFKPLPAPKPLLKAFIEPKIADNAVYWQVLLKGLISDNLLQPSFRQPLSDVLPRIRAPIFIMWGKNDQVLDMSAIELMKKQIAPAKIAIYEQVGHVPMMEVPDVVAHDLNHFWQTNFTISQAIQVKRARQITNEIRNENPVD